MNWKTLALVVFLFLAGTLFGRTVLWPPSPPRPPLPVKTDTVFVHDTMTVKEYIDRWRVERDTINLVRTVTIYDTTLVACQEIKPRRRMVSAVFGEAYGDSTFVLSERMSSRGDSLIFRLFNEEIYTAGMPARISIDSMGASIEWRDFPTQDNSISFFKKIGYMLIGAGAFAVIDRIGDVGQGSSDRRSSDEYE